MPDDLASTLAGIKALITERDDLAARIDWARPDDIARFDAAQDKLARRVPSLVAAVEAALSYHRPEETGWGTVCGGCWTRGGSHPVWPCAPMVDIVTALFPEEGSSD